MSCTGTKRSRNPGTSGPSSRGRTCKKKSSKTSSAPKVEKISKYFTKVVKNEDEDSNSSDLSDSPYKNCLSKVKQVKSDSFSDLDDFKTPKPINKVSKILNIKPEKNVKKRKKSRQPPLQKFVQDNLKHSDVNPDHLQMALVLSESSYEAENPGSQEKRTSFKEALEKFGFGYSKNKIPVNSKRDLTKKNKKSRYRFVTPILEMRTEEERQSLISSKVSLILTQNCRKFAKNIVEESPEIFSDDLKKYSRSRLMKYCNLELSELNQSGLFHVSGLGIEISHAPCGSLLKEWRKIPGREPTPERENVSLTPPTCIEKDTSNRISPKFLESFTSYEKNNRGGSPEKNNSSKYEIAKKYERESVNICSSSESPPTSNLGDFIEREDFSKCRLSLEISSPCLEKSRVRQNGNSACVNRDLSVTSPFRLSTDTIFPPLSGTKRSFECISPDLFESDDENSDKRTPIVDRLRGGVSMVEEMECYDLTKSDDEENYLNLKVSDRHSETLLNQDFNLVLSDSLKIQPDQEEERREIPEEKSFQWRLSDPYSTGNRSDLNVTDYVENLLSNYKEEEPVKKLEKISTSEDDSQQSQNSIYISDDELNYSSVFSAPHPDKKYELSEDEEFFLEVSLAERIKDKSRKEENEDPSEDQTLPYDYQDDINKLERLPLNDISISNNSSYETPNKKLPTYNTNPPTPNKDLPTPTYLEDSFNEVLNHIPLCDTPTTSGFLIKTKDVTPMANYDEMDTPKVAKELDKFGLKPLKRQKGAKLLRYIYESTHPVVEDENKIKKMKTRHTPQSGEIIIGDVIEEGEIIFERKHSRRVASCAVPLHIVWHNFVRSNPKIRENILLYEPLQLEVLHSMLKDQGFKFNIQDLLTFLDKKCITVRTAQGQHHTIRKPRRTQNRL